MRSTSLSRMLSLRSTNTRTTRAPLSPEMPPMMSFRSARAWPAPRTSAAPRASRRSSVLLRMYGSCESDRRRRLLAEQLALDALERLAQIQRGDVGLVPERAHQEGPPGEVSLEVAGIHRAVAAVVEAV